MRGAIAVLSTLCKRFAAILRCCDVESFINIGRLFPEIAPLEKRIDMHIDLLSRDEFREMECTSDINKYVRSCSVTELPFELAVTGSRHNSTT
jgi:dynactin 1